MQMCVYIYEEDDDQDEYEYRVGPSAEEKRTVYRINYESGDLISCFYCCLTTQISRTAQKNIHALRPQQEKLFEFISLFILL